MDTSQATTLFRTADDYFRQNRFPEALQILDRLNESFPDNHRVLYPRAMCLLELGNLNEADVLCDFLLDTLKYERARQLKQRIAAWRLEHGSAGDA